MTEEEADRHREECQRRAAALLGGSEARLEAVESAWLDIALAEGDRQLRRSPVSSEREHAAHIVDQIDKLMLDWKPWTYAYGSHIFALLTSAPMEELKAFRARAAAFAGVQGKRTGNVDASRKRHAADLALKLFEKYPPEGRPLDKQRALLAALLIGEPNAKMEPYIAEAKKRSRR